MDDQDDQAKAGSRDPKDPNDLRFVASRVPGGLSLSVAIDRELIAILAILLPALLFKRDRA
jgi:hypothetical protein